MNQQHFYTDGERRSISRFYSPVTMLVVFVLSAALLFIMTRLFTPAVWENLNAVFVGFVGWLAGLICAYQLPIWKRKST